MYLPTATTPTTSTTTTTPRLLHRRASAARRSSGSSMRVTVRDITAILSVTIKVEGFQFDSSIMEHPEFRISTVVVFQCQQHGGQQLETHWRVHRTFQEFQGLDTQLRQRFPFEMCEIERPRLHRRRALFRLHRTKTFLHRRCAELNAYLSELLDVSSLRLTRFMDPRAPLVLRCFCNFDAGFGRRLRVRANPFDSCVLCLDNLDDPRDSSDDVSLHTMADVDDELRLQEQELLHQQLLRPQWRAERKRADSKYDELETNLLDDRARNLVMCLRYECVCQRVSFRVTEDNMARILVSRGYRQVFRPPPDGPSALFCVLYRLQQHNDFDRRLFDILCDDSSSRKTDTKTDSRSSASDDGGSTGDSDAQLVAGVALLREALANYGLLYVHALERHFGITVVDLKKKVHAFKSSQHHRVGALELVLLCTMLDLSIKLVTNDHEATVQRIFPLSGLAPIRRGGRLAITLGYILPTMVCVDGLYVLADADANTQRPPLLQPSPTPVWLGLEEMDRCLVALIDLEIGSELRYLEPFDDDAAEALNRAILNAVWDDCQHNPNLFHLFQRQARQFGKARTTARQFVQYLEVAFGLEGATYLIDFLLHVLPEESLRKQLLRARWTRVRRHLAKRVATIGA